MLGQTSVGISLANLIHLASELRQQLNSHHAMISRALKKLGDVGNDISKDKLVILGIEPAQLGDPGKQCDESLDYELRQLWLVV